MLYPDAADYLHRMEDVTLDLKLIESGLASHLDDDMAFEDLHSLIAEVERLRGIGKFIEDRATSKGGWDGYCRGEYGCLEDVLKWIEEFQSQAKTVGG